MQQPQDVRYGIMARISHDEIREKLTFHHNPSNLPDQQDLLVVHSNADTSGKDVIFFALAGCPPMGYGIFIQWRKLLTLYTAYCRPFEEIEVEEIVSGYE